MPFSKHHPQCWHNVYNLAFAILLYAASAWGQGPGLGNLSYSSDKVFKTLSTLQMRNKSGDSRGINNAAMLNGYLFLVYGRDSGNPGGGIAFLDISDPKNPKVVHKQDVDALRESHGFGFSSHKGMDMAVVQAVEGIQFWNFTDVRKPVLLNYLKLPGIKASDYDEGAWWIHWQAPWVWIGCGQLGVYRVDASDPSKPVFAGRTPTSQLGGFRIGPVFVVGNLLVASNVGFQGTNSGYAMVDISDPAQPALLSQRRDLNCYSVFVNGNRLYCAALDGKLHVRDISDPANPKVLPASEKAGGRGEYVHVQDGYAHMGVENRYAKIDLQTLKVVNHYSLPGSGQEGFCNPLGNLVLVGDDHGDMSALVPHQAEPDRKAPEPNMVSPASGAKDQAVTSRVGISFSDQIDLSTVSAKSFILREVETGKEVPGRFSAQMNIVNFSPEKALASGTTYEILLNKGGIRDFTGNALSAAFTSRFTTRGVKTTALAGSIRYQGRTQGSKPALGNTSRMRPGSLGWLGWNLEWRDGLGRRDACIDEQDEH